MINKKNLKILSDGLLELIPSTTPTEKVGFNMETFSRSPTSIWNSTSENVCETICCAVGWAPYFGIVKDRHEPYVEYSARVFGLDIEDDENTWNYLFSENWTLTDNTKKGAGLRIKYFLKHGLPEDWSKQMMGFIPLTYLEDDK